MNKKFEFYNKFTTDILPSDYAEKIFKGPSLHNQEDNYLVRFDYYTPELIKDKHIQWTVGTNYTICLTTETYLTNSCDLHDYVVPNKNVLSISIYKVNLDTFGNPYGVNRESFKTYLIGQTCSFQEDYKRYTADMANKGIKAESFDEKYGKLLKDNAIGFCITPRGIKIPIRLETKIIDPAELTYADETEQN